LENRSKIKINCVSVKLNHKRLVLDPWAVVAKSSLDVSGSSAKSLKNEIQLSLKKGRRGYGGPLHESKDTVTHPIHTVYNCLPVKLMMYRICIEKIREKPQFGAKSASQQSSVSQIRTEKVNKASLLLTCFTIYEG